MFEDDDDFDKVLAIIGNIIVLGIVGLFIVGLLYLIKVWFFGGF